MGSRFSKLTAIAVAGFATAAFGFAGMAHASTVVQDRSPAASDAGSGTGTRAVEFSLIINRRSGKCLDVYNGSRDNKAAVIQYTCDAAKTHQQWTLQPAGDGYFRIIAAHSGKCIDIWDSSQDPTADAIQYTCSPTKYNQQFRQVFTSGGYAYLVARHSGQCLDVSESSMSNKAQVHQDLCNGHRLSQEWILG